MTVKQSPAQVIVATILASLEAGEVPVWRKPWDATNDAPRGVDGRLYSGINAMIGRMKMLAGGYTDPRFLTYEKAQELGGNIRKGEKCSYIVWWKSFPRMVEDEESGEKVERGRRWVPLYHRVFNVEQAENLALKPLPRIERNNTPIEAAQAIIDGMPNPPTIKIGQSDRAYYVPSTDITVWPELNQYAIPEEFYSTAFHELGHSTGHSDRLGRKGEGEANHFGSGAYGQEELVAEFSDAFLAGESGIAPKTLENSSSYLAGWASKIKADPMVIIYAASQGQKAAEYILGRSIAEAVPEAEAA